MSSGERLRVAIIGLGLIGNRHAWAYEHHDQSTIVCVCDQDPARARAAGERYGCDAVTSYEDVAKRADIDLVSVGTPDPDHFEPVLAMLEMGKHVLCEKPLTMAYAQARLLVDEATRRGLTLTVRLPQRYVAEHQRLRTTITSGRLGDLVSANIRSVIPMTMPTQSCTWASRSDLHWMYHQHRYDLLRWLSGLEAAEVYARGYRGVLTAQDVDCYDSVQVIVTYVTGASAIYDTSWINPTEWRPRGIFLDLLFTNGRASAGGLNGPAIAVRSEPGDARVTQIVDDPLITRSGELPENQWRPVCDVVSAIIGGQRPPVTAEDALAVMAILEATDRSLEEHRPVKISEIIESVVAKQL